MKKLLLLFLFVVAFTGIQAQVIFYCPFNEDFESNSEWVNIDGDELAPGEYFDYPGTIWVDPAWKYSSSWRCAMSNSRFTSPGKANNWLILPQFSLPNTIPYIKWKGRDVNQTNGHEEYEILISTTDNDTSSFTKIVTINEYSTNYKDWSLVLDEYAGQDVYIAFRHVTFDAYLLCIDDIEVGGTYNLDLAIVKTNVPNVVLSPSSFYIGNVVIDNKGITEITSYDLNWSLDNGTVYTKSYTGLDIDPLTGSVTVTHPDQPEINTVNQHILKVWVSNVNGGPDENSSNDTLTYHIGGISMIPTKNVIVEEGTGTWCSYCTDGAVRLLDILETVPNTIGVAIHSNDVMSCADGDTILEHYISALPRGAVDRVKYEEYEDVGFSRGDWKTKTIGRTSAIVPAEVTIYPEINTLTNILTVDISTKFYGVFNDDYRISVMILEDSVTGGSEYDQSNYYNDQPGHPMYGLGNPIVGYVHDNVLRKTLGGTWGLAGIIPETTADLGVYIYTFTDTIPEEWDINHIEVIGVLQNYSEDVNQRSIINSTIGDNVMVGVPKNVSTEKVNVFPNPSKGMVYIEAKNIVFIYIYDIAGTKVYEGKGSSLDLSGLSRGFYIMEIGLCNKTITKELILN
jgi:hypothetical protein